MSESPCADFGADFDAGFDPVDAEPVDDGPPPPTEDVVDAEFVTVLPDGTVLSNSTEIEVAPVAVTVTDIDGEPVEDPDKAGFPTLPGIGERPAGGSTNRDADAAQHGQQRYPGAGGGSSRRGLFGRRKRPRAAGASFGGGGGGSGGKHFSLIGGLNFLSGNRAEVSAVRAGPIASPHVTGVNTAGRRSSPRRFW